jgi:hypothetical protein
VPTVLAIVLRCVKVLGTLDCTKAAMRIKIEVRMVRIVKIICIKVSGTIRRPIKIGTYSKNLKQNFSSCMSVNTGLVINSIILVLDVEL